MRLLVIALLVGLPGCADLSYYMHSVRGHLDVINRSQPIDELLQAQSTEADLRRQLELVGQIRQFAFEQLHLPESDSYTEYADLQRDYVLKSLFASEEFSIAAHQWCYPIVGCAGYRGYFDEQRLQRYIDELKSRRFDVFVARVPAYSTLGWFDDPVLNTFIHWPDYRLAGLIFHELSHQRLYIDGDTTFNESFAMAVQHAGVEKWLQQQGRTQDLAAYQRHLAGRDRVMDFIAERRSMLSQLYRQSMPPEQKRVAKEAFLQAMQDDYQTLSNEFEGRDGFAKWFAGGLNNAKLVSVSTYHARTPAFRRLLEHHDGDFDTFFRHVERIGDLPTQQRQRCLDQWQHSDAGLLPARADDLAACQAESED